MAASASQHNEVLRITSERSVNESHDNRTQMGEWTGSRVGRSDENERSQCPVKNVSSR